MVTKYRVCLRIRRIRSKAKVRESVKELNYICRMLSREARYKAVTSNEMFCDSISFAINAVSVVSLDIAEYLLFCVGYNDIGQILKSIRRYYRKNYRGH